VLSALPAGSYSVAASTAELITSRPVQVVLSKETMRLDLRLSIKTLHENVTVEDNSGPTVSTEAVANANGLVLRGDGLAALSDDPDDLQADLLALAGPAAGPNSGAIYIDGFSGGELPAKNAIREVRINQNPFSPEFDKLGYTYIATLHDQKGNTIGAADLRLTTSDASEAAKLGRSFERELEGKIPSESDLFASAR